MRAGWRIELPHMEKLMQGLNMELSVPGVLKALRRTENETARDLRSGSSRLGWGKIGQVPGPVSGVMFSFW